MVITAVSGSTAVRYAGNSEGRLTTFDAANSGRVGIAEKHQIIQNRLSISVRTNVSDPNDGVIIMVIHGNRDRVITRHDDVVDRGVVSDVQV